MGPVNNAEFLYKSGKDLHVAILSLHTSPFVQPGQGDSGGMNVYIRELVSSLAHKGTLTSIYVRKWKKDLPKELIIEPGVRLVHIEAGDPELSKDDLLGIVDDFTEGIEIDLMLKSSVDVLHANYWLSGVSGHALKHRLGLPLVTTFHTLGKAKVSSGEFEPVDRIVKEQDVIDCSEVVVANSSAEASQLKDLYGAPHERISVVPLGVQHAFFSPGNQDAARAALGLVNGPIITYVGRLQPLKGVELAIEMFSTLEMENATLLIVGGASGVSGNKEIAKLKQQVRSLGIESQVHLIRPQPHHILSTFYRASDVVVIPSRSESFGLVALEAAACGTPVVTASVGGLRDLVIHGETGFLVEERDPKIYAHYVNRILHNPLLSAEIAMSAAEKAQQYSWSKTSDQILNIYNSVTSKALVDCR